jgi:SAM-dependent methyltransferase
MAAESSDRDVAMHWNQTAETWAAHVREGWDVYREHYNPAFLEFVGDLSGMHGLDATRASSRGADNWRRSLARMLEFAREEERRQPLGIRYELASYAAMPTLADQSFDAVVSTMTLMDGADFPGAMREIRRVLKHGCDLIFSILHALRPRAWVGFAPKAERIA